MKAPLLSTAVAALLLAAPGLARAQPSGLRTEIGLRITHGVSMEIDERLGGQLASWAGLSLSFGGERVSGGIAYDAGLGTASTDAVAHHVSARVGYDVLADVGSTRVTISVGPVLRLGRLGTTACLRSCAPRDLEARLEAQGRTPLSAGALVALDALQPFGSWLVGLAVEVRATGPIDPDAPIALELVLGLRVALGLATE